MKHTYTILCWSTISILVTLPVEVTLINYLGYSLKDTIEMSASIATIAGLILAVYTLSSWKNNYKTQKADEFAVNILSAISNLHYLIESLRGARFRPFDDDGKRKEIENYHIPNIRMIIKESIDIRTKLINAEHFLIKNHHILSAYVELVMKKIISKMAIAIDKFQIENRSNIPIEERVIAKIIYPDINFETEKIKTKRSSLGTDIEIVDDDFNREIESAFMQLTKLLKENMVICNNRSQKMSKT